MYPRESHVVQLALVFMFLLVGGSSASAQRKQPRTYKPPFVSITTDDGESQLQLVTPNGRLYAPKPWEPTSFTPPSFSDLIQPRIVVVPNTWTPVGPAPLGTGNPVSGRITGIAAHPTDPNTIYIAAAGGGVWKTINGGTTWTPLTETQQTLSMGCLAISRSNPLVLYAGTGEANNSLDSNFGRGILVSSDAGSTWTLRTGPAGAFNTSRMTCSQIAVDPTNPNIAYAAMANFGNNGNGGSTGVYKTTDGGATWTNVTAADGKDNTDAWSDVAVDSNTPATIYAAVGNLFGSAGNAIYKSTNSGTNWTQVTAANAPLGFAFGRISLALSIANAQNIIYAASSDPFANYALKNVVRSDNAAASFNLLAAPNYMGQQGWYDQYLADDPGTSAIAYAAGSANANSVLRTITSGGLFTDISTGTTVSPHVDHHAVAFDANGRLLDGDDGGIWRLDVPAGPIWSNLNGNLNTIQFMGVGLHPTDDQKMVAGSQDNGTELYSGTVVWTVTDGGDGGDAKYHSTNGNILYHQIPNGSFGTNFFRVSVDGGNNWFTQTNSISGDVNNQQFYAPFKVDPGNGDRVLYGTNRVWETTNASANIGGTTGTATWTARSAVNTAGFNSAGTFVSALGIAPSDVNTIYAATGGSLFVTSNRGTSWTQHNLPVAGTVQDIQVDPTVPATAYAVINQFTAGGQNVFQTTNGGTNWTNITGNLAAVTSCGCAPPVWSLQIDKTNNRLFIGADDGVYVTANGGTTWARFGTALPNAQVFQVSLNTTTNTLGAATHGRGAWVIKTTASTAADVSVSGRVMTSAGSGIRGAIVSMTDMRGNVRRAIANAFGYYSFENVEAGVAYAFQVSSSGFSFSPRVISLTDAMSDLNFTGSH